MKENKSKFQLCVFVGGSRLSFLFFLLFVGCVLDDEQITEKLHRLHHAQLLH